MPYPSVSQIGSIAFAPASMAGNHDGHREVAGENGRSLDEWIAFIKKNGPECETARDFRMTAAGRR